MRNGGNGATTSLHDSSQFFFLASTTRNPAGFHINTQFRNKRGCHHRFTGKHAQYTIQQESDRREFSAAAKWVVVSTTSLAW